MSDWTPPGLNAQPAWTPPGLGVSPQPSITDHILNFIDKASHLGQNGVLTVLNKVMGLPQGTISQQSIKNLANVDPNAKPFPMDNLTNPMLQGLGETKIGNAVTSGLVDAVTSPMSYVGELAKPIAWGAKGIVPLAAKVGDLMSHASPEALTQASFITKGGRQGLLDAAKNADNLGPQLSAAVDKFTSTMPEKAVIDQAIPQMGKVDIQPAIDALKSAKPKVITGKLSPDQQINSDKISKYVDYLKGDNSGTSYPAQDALDIRKVLDSPIDYETGLPNSKDVQGALFKARTALRSQLEDAATATNNPQYIDAMKSYHDKLDIVSQLQNLTQGTTDIGTDKKSTNLLASLFKSTPDAAIKRKAVSDFDNVAGTDFLGQAKKTFLAAQKGYGKQPYEATKGVGIFTPIAEKLASAGASQVAIPAAKGLEVLGKVAAPASKIAGESLLISRLKNIIQNPQSPEQKVAAQNKLAQLQGTP